MVREIKITLSKDEVAEAVTDYLRKKKEIGSSYQLSGEIKLLPSNDRVTGTWVEGRPSQVSQIRDAIGGMQQDTK